MGSPARGLLIYYHDNLDHDDGILLRVQGKRKHQELCKKSKQDNGNSIVSRQLIAGVHQVTQGNTKQHVDNTHYRFPLVELIVFAVV